MSRLTQKVFGIAVTNKAWPVENVQSLSEFNTFKGFLMGEAVEKLARYEDLGEPEELQRKPEWISVEDRLPEVDETGYTYVLVCMDDEFITTADFTTDESFGLWEDSGEVTHWMPLPEPPKE